MSKEKMNLREIELKDTTDLMCSNDYKERFLGEYIQLKIRYNKLREIIIKYKANKIEFECDITLLEHQLYYMEQYIMILEIRAEKEYIELPKPTVLVHDE